MSWAGCISQTDQMGHTTRYEYDTLGRLYKVTDPMGHASYFGYDALGEKTSQTDANGHVTYFAYDNRGRLVTKTLPLGQSDNRTYDTLGRLSTMTDFNGKVTTLGYDPASGRLMSKTASVNGTPTGEGVTFVYNLLDGSRKSATRTPATGTGASVVTTYAYYGYDASGNPTPDFRQGQLKNVTTQTGAGPLLTISYNYDLLGNKIAMQTPSGKAIGYGYDILNRLQTVTHPDGAVTTFGYDKVGNRQSVTRATSTGIVFSTTGYTYDTLNRLTDIVNKNGSSAVVSSYHYGLRLDGKRGSVIETGPATSNGTTNYTYDDQGKLTQEAGPYATIAYGYDNVGNRLLRTVTNAASSPGTTLVNGVTNTVFDNNDRITSQTGTAPAVTHTYDADGNEKTVNGQTATYDFENHLVSLGSTASYIYDADGNRTSVSSAGTTTNYVVDTSLPYASVVEEYNGTTLAARYDYGDDLVRMDRGSGVYYYLYDGLGSTRQLVNTSGTVTDSYGYSAFGEMASHTGGTVNPFLFNAQQFDSASGDYFLRARYYDQSNGRFISQDPYSGSNSDPVSLHRYLYASGDPVDRDDPGGEADGDLPSVGAVVSGISTLAGGLYSAYAFATNPTAGNGALLALSVIPGEGLLGLFGKLAINAAKFAKLAKLAELGLRGGAALTQDALHLGSYFEEIGAKLLGNDAFIKAAHEVASAGGQGLKDIDGLAVLADGKAVIGEAKSTINLKEAGKLVAKFEDSFRSLKAVADQLGTPLGAESVEELVVVYKDINNTSGLVVKDGIGYFNGNIMKATIDGVETTIKFVKKL